MIENPEDIELRSEEVQEILGTPPNWLIRWGSTIVFLVVMALLVVSWLVKYPDVIAAKVMISTPNLPVTVVTRSAGFLDALYVKEGTEVKAGDALAVMENPAQVEDVLALEEGLKWLQEAPRRLPRFNVDEDWELGGLQPSLSRLMQVLKDYNLTINKRFDLAKTEQLEKQIEKVKSLNEALRKQQEGLKKEFELIEKNYNRSKKLLDEKVISPKQFEDDETRYLQKKREVDNVETAVINNEIQMNNLEAEITNIQQDAFQTNSAKFVQVSESINLLLSEIEAWKQQFLLLAPISGRVSLNLKTEERQFVSAGEEIITIVPNEKSVMQGNVKLPIAGSGKVELGQRVNIKLDGFPFQEYGIVRGKVENMSAIPREGLYDVTVSLPDGLRTSYKKELRFQQQMEGTAEVITKERRLIERFFERLIAEFRK